MTVKKKSSLKRPKGIREQGKVSVSKKSSIIQKRDSKNLGKTAHKRQGSLTEMKKEKIEERIDRLASFPELHPSPIVELDLMGQVQYLNPSAESLFPDLRSKGSNHPWIADFGSLTGLVNRHPPKAHLREKRVGDSWYQQVIYYTPEWNRIRLYGYDITEGKQAEEELRRSHDELEIRFQERTYDLNERVKKLNCLSLISDVLNKPDIPFEKVFEETAIMLPSAFQFPEIACARITLRGQEFKSQNYRETAAWKLKSEILSRGKPVGIIELNYLEEKPVCYEGPFLKEEKIIIDAIALQLGEYIERIETQADLAEQRRILEGFFTSTITPLVLLDKDFNFIRVNEAYAKACQRDVSDFPGHNHFEFYPNKENEAIFRRVVESRVPFQAIEKAFAFPDHPEWGVTYWDWTLTPLLNATGEVEFLVFSLEDVTERRRAEDAVKAERQRFNDVLEMLPAYLVLLTPDYHVPFANRFFRERFGESHGRRCFEYLFGRSEPCEVCETYTVLKTMAPHEWEWTGPDGRNYQVFDFPFTDTDGSNLILEIGIDITEHKQAEEALRQNEELLRNVLELLPVGIWITDKNGVITQGNPAGHHIWGGCRHVGIEKYGEYKGWWLDTGKRIEPKEWAAARAIMKGEISLSEEIEIECFDGTHKIILNSAIPRKNKKNEIIGSIIINDDITERKRNEKAIRQMQKMEALGTLAGGIAHDFNNILMPIVINTELALLDTPEGSPISNYLKMIQEAANRGKDLIKQIITFSRQKEQAKAPIEIGPVIREALKFLRSSIPKNIEIREHIEAAPSTVLADPTQMHQVLMNLCSNASYAMREKGGILDVSLMASEVDAGMANRHLGLKPGPYLRLTVADTGGGMDKEIMERIFDPFFTTKKPGEGTGMGLSVVHGIVKNHGGAITVYNEVGKGATFNIFLPMIKEELKTETAPSETITTGKERILLIDDEEIQIRSVQPMLERLGYRVFAKTDALEALEIFRLKPDEFDLVITDQTMPHLMGRELAKEFLRTRPDIPVILCTGFSEVIHEEEAKATGIREFIMKPFSLNEMARIIRKALKRNGQKLGEEDRYGKCSDHR